MTKAQLITELTDIIEPFDSHPSIVCFLVNYLESKGILKLETIVPEDPRFLKETI